MESSSMSRRTAPTTSSTSRMVGGGGAISPRLRDSRARSTASVATVCGQTQLTRTPSTVPSALVSRRRPALATAYSMPRYCRLPRRSRRADVDDTTRSFGELRQRSLDRLHHGEKVELDDRSPVVIRGIGRRCVAAGVIHQHVELAQARQRLHDHPVGRARLSEIDDDVGAFAIGDQNLRARATQTCDDRGADARGAARHERRTARKPHDPTVRSRRARRPVRAGRAQTSRGSCRASRRTRGRSAARPS